MNEQEIINMLNPKTVPPFEKAKNCIEWLTRRLNEHQASLMELRFGWTFPPTAVYTFDEYMTAIAWINEKSKVYNLDYVPRNQKGEDAFIQVVYR